MMKPRINLISLNHYPIIEQLQLEEALLKADNDSWCIINSGTPPAIVMGISGKKELLVDSQRHAINPLPIIRRFSGGGTVVVDEHTLFITFICNSSLLEVPSYPEPIFKWTEQFYQPVFANKPFKLKENDYVMGENKFGGNAQYLRKHRWLHHSSLLWDFHPERMDLLLIPPKMPSYRDKRPHSDFLFTLKRAFSSKDHFWDNLKAQLDSHFAIQTVTLEEALSFLDRPHHKSTTSL